MSINQGLAVIIRLTKFEQESRKRLLKNKRRVGSKKCICHKRQAKEGDK